MSQEIELLRKKLDQTNGALIELMHTRQTIISDIQELKANEQTAIFNPQREKELFTQPLFHKLSLTQAKVFSFLMQEQVRSLQLDYPNWSQGEHLANHPEHDYERVNPLLLKECYPELFSKLKLKSDFDFIKRI